MKKTKSDLEKLHSLRSFGNVPAERGDIRTERLELRLVPKVPFPHKHDFYQIVVITQGSGTHEVDFKTFKVVPRQIFILKPGQVHSWTLHSKTKGFLIEFTMESLTTSSLVHSANFIQRIQTLPDEMRLSPIVFAECLPTLELMAEESLTPKTDSGLYLQSSLSIFLIDLFRANSRQAKKIPAAHSEIGVRFVDLVEAHYKTEHHLEFYAKALNLPPKILAERIRKNLGRSPKDIIQDRRILEAKRLLVYSELSVAQIGYRLGFDDANYFSRFFKYGTKISAQTFRDQNRPS